MCNIVLIMCGKDNNYDKLLAHLPSYFNSVARFMDLSTIYGFLEWKFGSRSKVEFCGFFCLLPKNLLNSVPLSAMLNTSSSNQSICESSSSMGVKVGI